MTARTKASASLYWPLFVALAASICAVEIWMTTSPFFTQNPTALVFGITADLVIVIPSLYYFLVVRQKQAPVITLAPVVVIALAVASFILPAGQQNNLAFVKKAGPLLELAVLGYLATPMRAIVKNFRASKSSEIYFIDALAESGIRNCRWPGNRRHWPAYSFVARRRQQSQLSFIQQKGE